MIDERFLRTFQFVYTGQDKREFIEWANSSDENLKELIHLARLGLQHEKLQSIYGTPEGQRLMALGEWAEKHGIPALQAYESTDETKEWCDFNGMITKWFHGVVSGQVAQDALAALPKEPTDG